LSKWEKKKDWSYSQKQPARKREKHHAKGTRGTDLGKDPQGKASKRSERAGGGENCTTYGGITPGNGTSGGNTKGQPKRTRETNIEMAEGKKMTGKITFRKTDPASADKKPRNTGISEGGKTTKDKSSLFSKGYALEKGGKGK